MSAPDTDSRNGGFPNKATPVGSSAYYSIRFSPPALRNDLALLFAWHGEMRGAVKNHSDPGVARLKLQWWREELIRCSQDAAQHPLTKALTPLITKRRLPLGPFLSMANEAESAIMKQSPKAVADLEQRCELDQGSLFELIGRCHGIIEPCDLSRLRRLGAYCGVVCLIRDFGVHLRRGYNPLPASLAASADKTSQTGNETHREPLRQLASHARELIATRHSAPITEQSKPANRSTLVSSRSLLSLPQSIAVRTAILTTLLDEIQREDFSVITQRICLTPIRKLWIGWRAARRQMSG